MQAELDRARERMNEVRSPRAKAALEGVMLALRWVIEGQGGASPVDAAASLRSEHKEPEKEAPKPAKKPAKK